jgi:hypothetical protein
MKILFALLLLFASHVATAPDASAQTCPKGRVCGAVCCP